MNPTEFWTLALSICGAGQCFFLACCFGLTVSKDHWTPAVPALLMLLLGIRIFKSVIYLLEGEGMSVLFMNSVDSDAHNSKFRGVHLDDLQKGCLPECDRRHASA
jgi:hypothetical protein